MSHQETTDRSWWVRLDVLSAAAGLLFALMFVPLYLAITHLFILGIPLMVGFASVVYLLSIRNTQDQHIAPLPTWLARLCPSLCALGLAALVGLAAVENARTVRFYSVAIVVAVIIFYQILFAQERDFSVPVVLGQVVVLALVLRIAALYTTPEFVGIDIWTHVPNWTTGIVETASLSPLEENKYYAAPWFHLLVSAAALFGGLSVEHALNLSVGLLLPLLVLVVYVTGRLFTSPRWSTFAAALFAIVGYAIEWSIHLIPTSLGLVFFAGSFYLLCRLLYFRFDTTEFALLVGLNIAIVLTHQVATFITLVLLSSSVIALLVLPTGLFPHGRGDADADMGSSRLEATNLGGLLVFDVGFVTFMWSLTPHHGRSFLETMLIFFRNTLTESEGFGDLASQREAAEAPPLETTMVEVMVSYIDATVFLALFFLAVVGGLYVMHQRNLSYAPFMMGLSIVAMAVFVFGFPVFGIRSFIPNRWYAFMALPMVLLAAFGAAHLSRRLNSTAAVTLLLVFVLVFPAASLVSSGATIDSPPFDSEQTRYSYTEPELAAVQTVDAVFPPADLDADEDDEALQTDHPYQTVFERTAAHPAGMLELSEEGMAEAEVIVFREYQRSGAAYFGDAYNRTISPEVSAEQVCPPGRSPVYDNGDVSICVA